MLAATPQLGPADTVLFLVGGAILFLYGWLRARGRAPLRLAAFPEPRCRDLDALVLILLGLIAQFVAGGLAGSLGVTRPTRVMLLGSLGLFAVAAAGGHVYLRPPRPLAVRARGGLLGILAWAGTFPVVAAVLLAWAALLSAAGYEWREQAVLTLLRGDPVAFLVVAVVIAPFAEEILYRGLLYAGLRQRLGKWPALLISAAAFALVHNHVGILLPLFVLGGLLAYVYERTGTLAAPMLFHLAFNGWQFLGVVLGGDG